MIRLMHFSKGGVRVVEYASLKALKKAVDAIEKPKKKTRKRA